MKAHPDLKKFIKPYSKSIQKLTLEIREFIVNTVPDANELIWDNYNAVAIAYSKSEKLSDAFCHISVYSKHVNLGFNRGVELKPSSIKLLGKGKLIRHIKVVNMESLPKEDLQKMILEAMGIAEKHNPVESNKNPKSLVMSVSEKKIRPQNI